jgi:uncharacterized protein (DUF1684 family)
MRGAFFTILILLSLTLAAQAQDIYGTNNLKAFREGREKEFRNPVMSPLKPEDVSIFKGLIYFQEDKNFVVKAKLEKSADEKFFLMPTSAGTSRKYIKYGVLKFKLGEIEYALNAYQSEAILLNEKSPYKNLLFIPFKDLTNGKETYGAGRYLNINKPDSDEVFLDFNLAYNPSCAYGNESFSCPLPPKENFLQAEIKAGEKAFEYSGKKPKEQK